MNEEDWEREFYKDYMYRVERQLEMEEEWYQWEEEKNRKPAIIKLLKHENNNKCKSVSRINKEEFFD
jgi:hypothetical protein